MKIVVRVDETQANAFMRTIVRAVEDAMLRSLNERQVRDSLARANMSDGQVRKHVQAYIKSQSFVEMMMQQFK